MCFHLGCRRFGWSRWCGCDLFSGHLSFVDVDVAVLRLKGKTDGFEMWNFVLAFEIVPRIFDEGWLEVSRMRWSGGQLRIK